MILSTPRRRVLFLRRFLPVLLAVFGVFSILAADLHAPKVAYAASSDTVNFQARLQTSSGAIVPDGTYNVEFKLYTDQGTSSNPGSCTSDCVWREDYTATSGPGSTDARLQVKDGYLSTSLGSITAFGTGIDWSQQMYLTMDIGGTGSSASWDGEMTPRLALTATPYAFEAKNSDTANSATTAGELTNTTSGNLSTLSFQGSSAGTQNFVVQDQGSGGTYHLLTNETAANSYIRLQGGSPTAQTGNIDINGTVTASNVTVGTTGSGGQMINNGATLDTAKSLGNITGSSIGSASTTVDVYTALTITQTTGSVTASIPSPTNTAAGRIIYISNLGSSTQSITVGGILLPAGSNAQFIWNGSAWVTAWANTGTAAGDLSGNYPNPTVAKIQNTPVTITSLTDTNLLVYNGTAWVNESFSGDVSVTDTGAATIGAGVVTGSKIAASTITNTNLASGSYGAITSAGNLVTVGALTGGSIASGFGTISTGNTITGTTINASTGTLQTNGTTRIDNTGNFSGGTVNGDTVSSSAFTFSGATGTIGATGSNSSVTVQAAGTGTLSLQAGGTGSVLVGTTAATTVTIGNASSGGVLVNNGATENSVVALSDNGTNNSNLTTAANLNAHTSFTISQTTSGISLNIPSPTVDTGNAHVIYVANIGTTTVTIDGVALIAGSYASFAWNGTVWAPSATGVGNSYIANTTSLQSGNMYVQAASSGSVAAKFEANSSGTGDILDLLNGSASPVATFGYDGRVLFKTTSGHDSVTAFQVQSSGSSTSALDVDTTNGRVGINTNAPGYALDVNGTVNSNTGIDVNGTPVCTTSCIPSPGSGNYVQNTTGPVQSGNLFLQTGNAASQVGILRGASSQSADLFDIQTWNGTSATNVDTFSSNGTFTVQNASGNAIFTASTSAGQVTLGSSSHVNGALTFDDSSDSDTVSMTAGAGGTLTTTVTGAGTGSFGAPSDASYGNLGSATPGGFMGCSLFIFSSRQNATANSITLYTATGAGTGTKDFGLAIYTGDGNQPTTLVSGSVGTGTLLTSPGANTVSISATLTANTQYWLCTNQDNSTAQIATNYGAQTPSWYMGETYGTWPSTISGGSGFRFQATYEMVVNYTLAGSSSTVASTNNTGQVNLQGVNDSGQAFVVQDTAGDTILGVSTGSNSAASSVDVGNGYLNLVGLSNPSGITVALSNGGSLPASTTIDYAVDAVDSQGHHTEATDAAVSFNGGNLFTTGSGTTNRTATINWNAVPGAVSYTVYFTTNDNTWYTDSVPAGTTSLVDDGTIYSAEMSDGDTGDPSLFTNSTTGLYMQSGSNIWLDSGGGNTAAEIGYDNLDGKLLIDNENTNGIVGVQGNSFSFVSTAGFNQVFNVSSAGSLSFNGSLTGTSSINDKTDTTTHSYTVSTPALTYELSNNSGTSTSNPNDTFNITGLSNVEGTIAYIRMVAQKGSTTAGKTSTVTLQINGSGTIGGSSVTVQNNTTGGGSTEKNFMLIYLDGGWKVMGGEGSSDGADYAEYIDYSGSTAPQPGDVLTVGDDDTSAKDASTPYDSRVIGVVSSNPYQVGGTDDGHSVVLALTGRVPVKVSLENGPIEPGDPLTSSSTPGVAMKATAGGKIIGTALETYDGTQSSNEINVQLQVGYNNSDPGTIQGDANVSGGLYVAGDANIEGNLTVAGTTSTQNLSVSGTADLAVLTVSGGVSASSVTVSGAISGATLSVSGSASFGGDITLAGHFITGGTAPTTALNANAGNTATCTVTGNDTSGTIALQSNGTGQAAGAQCVLTFNKAFDSAPRTVLSPNDSASAAMGAFVQAEPTTLTLNFTAVPTASQTYTYNYFNPQ